MDETWKVDWEDDDKGEDRSPVDTTVIAVYALVLVKHRHVETGAPDDPVVSDLDIWKF